MQDGAAKLHILRILLQLPHPHQAYLPTLRQSPTLAKSLDRRAARHLANQVKDATHLSD